jgi:DNA-binding CsgD family transcriptional regulator
LIDDADTALSVTDVEWPHVASSGQFGEFLACRALANARVTGEHDQSLSLLAQAEGASRENESSSLCGCVKALLSLDSKELQATEQTISAFHKGLSKGIIDPYVFAFRLDKRLPRLISRAPHLRSAIRELLPLLDATASATLQLPTQLSPATLTEALSEREMEVLALIVGGNTNKEIGALLFLTESTVKAHVRNILRKLGVRTRTELAILALRTQQREGGGLVDLESALEPPDPPI